jgi:hypothetical protein
MKRVLLKIVLCILLIYDDTRGEGTKQLRPAYTDNAHIVLMADDNDFASYDAPANNRIQFYVSNLNERVYFGFGRIKIDGDPGGNNGGNLATYDEDLTGANAPGTLLFYRIIAPSGAIVMSGQVPTTGQGYIGNESQAAYNRAVNGPRQFFGNTGGLGNNGGYNALKLIPTEIGDYRIEFNLGNVAGAPITKAKTSLQLFDLTVTNGKGTFDADASDNGSAATQVINGRLWSRAWRFSTGANQAGGDPFNQNLFKAKLYPYAEDGNTLTPDGVVTELDFNGMDPFGFTVSCNRNGVQNPSTGDFVLDKRSVYGVVPSLPGPLYKIFLHDPDPVVYPNGIVGCLTGNPTVTQCASGSAYCINIFAIAVGDVSVLIDLDKSDGIYTPNTRDVLLQTTINQGDPSPKCVPWNGLDGTGVQVPDGPVQIIVVFQAGLTNLPINDVENNANGFRVSLVRPSVNACGNAIVPPRLYWSDVDVDDVGTSGDGIENLAGCDPNSLAPGVGCHQWTGRGANSGAFSRETMNTWWYVAEDKRVINFVNDNSLFGITADFGNTTCVFTDFSTIEMEVEYSQAKFDPTQFTYTITSANAPAYSLINEQVLSTNNPGSTAAKRKARIRYTLDVGNDNLNTGALTNSLGFTYKVQTNQCGSPLDVSQNFTCQVGLPVRWMTFTARRINDEQVKLEWQTKAEYNNSVFTVERSLDGKIFNSVSSIDAKGNSQTPGSYNFTDLPNHSGILYYRIKQTDITGENSYSKVVTVRIEELMLELINCYYNQTDQTVTVSVKQKEKQAVSINLFNMLGVKILQKQETAQTTDIQNIEIPVTQLPTGNYIVEVRNKTEVIRKKIVIY